MYRVGVYLLSVTLTGLVLWPAFRDPPQDSFPLSNFPMFSAGRPDPMLTLPHARAINPDNTRTPLPPDISAGTWEVLQSMMTIDAAIAGGRETARTLCHQIAERVAASDDPQWSEVVAVELAISRFDCIKYFEGETEPVRQWVQMRCTVER